MCYSYTCNFRKIKTDPTDEKGRRNSSDHRRSSLPEAQKSPRSDIEYHVGQQIEAKITGWTKYYTGEITRARSDGSYDIKFEDGERKTNVQTKQIRSISTSDGGAQKQNTSSRGGNSRFRQAKYTLNQRVEARSGTSTSWKSARIGRVHSDGVYDIKFNNGTRELRVDSSNIRAIDNGGESGGLGSLQEIGEDEEDDGW